MLLKYQVVFVACGTLVILAVIIIVSNFSPSQKVRYSMAKHIKVDLSISSVNELVNSTSFNKALVKSSLQKKGYSVADLPPWTDLWTDKIRLCIMFNLNGIKPRKDVTEILISYYYPFFRDITFIFDEANSKRPDFLPEFVDFISCDSHLGWYQQKCIRSCMHRGTEDTKGYLYIADDMFINLTKMANLPSTKIWFIKIQGKDFRSILNPKTWNWYWWGPPANGAKNLKIVVDSFPTEWMEQLRKTGGFPEHLKSVGTSDIIYIPQALVTNMTTVLDFIIDKALLFCEIATCLAVDIVAPDYVVMNNGYLWLSDRTSIAIIEERAKTAHFIHPLKLGNGQHVKIWIKYMEEQMYHVIRQRKKLSSLTL